MTNGARNQLVTSFCYRTFNPLKPGETQQNKLCPVVFLALMAE